MGKKRLCIIVFSDIARDSRVLRQVECARKYYEVDVVGLRAFRMEGVQPYLIGSVPQWSDGQSLPAKLKRVVFRNFNLLIGNYEDVNASRLRNTSALIAEIEGKNYDLIVSHDLVLLPFVFKVKGTKTRVMLDAREYYPKNYNDQWLWRRLKKPVNEYSCREYLQRCDKIITVSDGLAEEYNRRYKVHPEVVMSLPVRWDLQPLPPVADRIRVVHHGVAGKSRRTEIMLEMMDYVDERFTLDMMMVVRDVKYWNKVVSMANKRKNIRIVPPVPMQEIIPVTNRYNIGLFLVPPTNFNLRHTLPNKLFKFIQARLLVTIGPSIEMSKIVQKFNCGVVARDFDPRSLANELNRLTIEKIAELKENSHKAARELNAEVNAKRIREIVSDLASG
jgi:hypothetical protein